MTAYILLLQAWGASTHRTLTARWRIVAADDPEQRDVGFTLMEYIIGGAIIAAAVTAILLKVTGFFDTKSNTITGQ
jgi:hypothetical protein